MNLRRKTEKEKEWTSSGRSRRYIWIERSMFSIVYCKTGWQRNRNINTVTMIQSWPQAQCYIPPFTIPRPKVKKHKTQIKNKKRDLDCEVTGAFNHATGKAGSSVSSHRLLALSCHPRLVLIKRLKFKRKSYSPESTQPSRWKRESGIF